MQSGYTKVYRLMQSTPIALFLDFSKILIISSHGRDQGYTEVYRVMQTLV